MAGNTTKNEVAAKMIGAQLQSLLKIPPIKKVEGEQKPETVKPETRGSSGKGEGVKRDGGRFIEEKENSRNVDHNVKRPGFAPSPDSTVARDRFGRPFQSLDRRGRGRDFHNVPKRLNSTNQRDAQVQHVQEPPPRTAAPTEPLPSSTGGHQSKVHPKTDKGRQHQPQHRHATDSQVGSTISKTVNASNNNSFEERTSHKQFSSYEQPPRFSGGEETSSRLKGRDPVDPSIRRLVRKPDCPLDIKEKVDHLYDESYGWPNELGTTALRRHFISFIQTERKNPKYPRARFYCNCCNYHLDNLNATVNHILQERHYALEKMLKITRTLAFIPTPSGEHASYLTDLLVKTSKLHGMNHTERMQRLDIGRRLSEAIKENNLDCQATIFGSSLSGFGFRDSNVNININVGSETSPIPSETDQPTSPRGALSNNAEFSGITTKLLGIIKTLPHVSERKVKEVYTPKCVSIHFEEDKSRTSCIVHFNNSSAVLVAQLFAEYNQMDARVKPLVLCFRHWARICDLDDQEKGFLPAHCYTIMVIHYLQSREQPVLPILHLIPKVATERLFATADEAKKHWKTKNTETLGELWLGLLQYYSLKFDWRSRIISISREYATIPKDEKQWNRKLCVEDPIIPKSNLSRSVTNNKICEYIIDRIKLAYQYFGIPRKESGPLYEGACTDGRPEEIFKVVIENSKPTTSQALQRMVRKIQKDPDPDGWDTGEDDLLENEVRMVKVFWKQNTMTHVCADDIKKLRDVLYKKQYHYEFKVENFTDGTLPPIICKSCGAEGHLRSNCPEETVPPYSPVEYPTPLTLTRLNKAIAYNYEREALDDRDVMLRKRIVDEVKAILLPVFPSIRLTLFGSTYNGFGMHLSDVDICLTFNDVMIPPGERGIRMIDINDVLDKVVSALKASGRMVDILSIPSAKVPIVKFRHAAFRLDGDVSLYNRLSIYNTELLRLYVDLDDRVAKLGLFLKKLVKLCDVGDASKGSLSSYSYILMLIHFLQNHSVPVLPVIQEIELPNMTNNFHCDNHLIKYHRDVDLIAKSWDGYGKNKESVSQLWLAFLNYYVEKFDHEKYVITISQSAPLTRAAKCWYSDALAIEDPFDKTHNLGSGLTRRMSVHILKTLQKCRVFFHRSTDHLRNDVNFLEYYMDVRQVREGNPPIDRQCRLCYRIGHFARNCTYVNKREDEEGLPSQQEIFPLTQEEADMLSNGTVQQRAMEKLPSKGYVREESPAKLPPPITSAKPLPSMPAKLIPTTSVKPPPTMLAKPPPAMQAKPIQYNNSPWPQEIVKREMSPDELRNGNIETPVKSVIRKPDVIAPPKTQADTALISHSLNALLARSRELEEAAKNEANKPVKEVVFFGDIGSPNADGEQIQAMLQKNEGVTFTFDPHQQQLDTGNTQTSEGGVNHHAVGNMQPPPGFCPTGNMYMGTGPSGHGLPYLPEQATARQMVPTPPGQQFNVTPIGMPIQPPPPQQQQQQQQQQPAIPYGHNPPAGIPLPFQSVMPIGSVPPFDNRPALVNGDNIERPPPVGVTTAPPPGFAPLPTVSSNCLPQSADMLRSYPGSPYPGVPSAPAVTMFSVAPVAGMGYQQIPNNVHFTSAPSAVVSTESGETGMNYRPVEGGIPTPIGQMNLIHHQNMGHGHMVSNFQHHVIPINTGIPNGQQIENGVDGSEPTVPYPKVTSITGDVAYNVEYGGGLACGIMPGGNPPASSYGLSLSQAHHGPVVSALQQMHSLQMQGGHSHFHHHMRPVMTLGNYPHGSPYPMHPQMHPPQTHGLDNNMIPMNADAAHLNQNINALEIKQGK